MRTHRLDPTGLATPGETPGLMGTGPGLDCQEAAGRVFGRFWNWTNPFLRSKPRPQAGYPDLLVTPIEVDRVSKMQQFIPCHPTIDAVGLAKLFLQEPVQLHRIPVTDNSVQVPQYTSTFCGQLCDPLAIELKLSTASQNQTDGYTEWMNANMKHNLCVC